MQHEKTKELAMTALMTALIFTATYIIKIPNPATGGYTHMGDCMIFLGVMVLGRFAKRCRCLGAANLFYKICHGLDHGTFTGEITIKKQTDRSGNGRRFSDYCLYTC